MILGLAPAVHDGARVENTRANRQPALDTGALNPPEDTVRARAEGI